MHRLYAALSPARRFSNRLPPRWFQTWTRVCNEEEIAEGAKKMFLVEDDPVLLAKVRGRLFGVSGLCPHLNQSMKNAIIDADQGTITCKFHRSVFDLETGEAKVWSDSVLGIPGSKLIGKALGAVRPPRSIPVYPIKVEQGDVFVFK
mmetsp:Transcript_15550/g.26745  ORF Transcript_15550/g.26745 Transcript_15550/m.26745 type:complete len:147 (-) Transcript_15550:268-708(-)